MTDNQVSRSFWIPFLLGGVATILVSLLWFGTSTPPPAYGQVPDSGAQRIQMIAEQKVTNQKLDQVINLLKEIRDQRRPTADSDRRTPVKRAG